MRLNKPYLWIIYLTVIAVTLIECNYSGSNYSEDEGDGAFSASVAYPLCDFLVGEDPGGYWTIVLPLPDGSTLEDIDLGNGDCPSIDFDLYGCGNYNFLYTVSCVSTDVSITKCCLLGVANCFTSDFVQLATELTTTFYIGGGSFEYGQDRDAIYTIENVGVEDSYNVQYLIKKPGGSEVATTFYDGISVPNSITIGAFTLGFDNEDFDIVGENATYIHLKLKQGLSIPSGGTKVIGLNFEQVGFTATDVQTKGSIIDGTGGDVDPNNNSAQQTFNLTAYYVDMLAQFNLSGSEVALGGGRDFVPRIRNIGNRSSFTEISFLVPPIEGFTTSFNPTQTSADGILGPITVNNSDWIETIVSEGKLYTTNVVIPNGGESSVAIFVTGEVNNALSNFTYSITSGSGGETNYSNNDDEKLAEVTLNDIDLLAQYQSTDNTYLVNDSVDHIMRIRNIGSDSTYGEISLFVGDMIGYEMSFNPTQDSAATLTSTIAVNNSDWTKTAVVGGDTYTTNAVILAGEESDIAISVKSIQAGANASLIFKIDTLAGQELAQDSINNEASKLLSTSN